MYIRYAYTQISTDQATADAQIAAILQDIVNLLQWRPDLLGTSAGYITQLKDTGVITSALFDIDRSQVFMSRYGDWFDTVDTTNTATTKYISNGNIFAGIMEAHMVLSTSPVAKTVDTGVRSSSSNDASIASTLNMKAYERQNLPNNTIVNNYCSGYNDAAFVKPVIYNRGGYLFITASKYHMLIACMNRTTSRWLPGLGVAMFDKEPGSYGDYNTYPAWCYMSMATLDCISVPRKYNIDVGVDTANPTLIDKKLNRMQVKGPFVNDPYSIAVLKNTKIPRYAHNVNLVKGALVARLKFHSHYDGGDIYDAGGDITSSTGIYIINIGSNMDTIDVLLPTHNSNPVSNTPDPKVPGFAYATTTDIHDPNYVYSTDYGLYVLWACGKLPGTAKSNTKFLIKLG
jgi:hypothetical protein